jgi:4-alpha-glucanotransferase
VTKDLYIEFLIEEIKSLRSVLSEWQDDCDFNEYVQWVKAEALREVRNHLIVEDD